MSSGGMYAERLDVDDLEMGPDDYDGVRAYARAKRAQVELTAEWARRGPASVAFHALHPGWADTPGVVESLPTVPLTDPADPAQPRRGRRHPGLDGRGAGRRARGQRRVLARPPPPRRHQGAVDPHPAGRAGPALGLVRAARRTAATDPETPMIRRRAPAS